MGGRGSGNHYHWHRASKKGTVEDCLTIDAGQFGRNKWFQQGEITSFVTTWTYPLGSQFTVHLQADTRVLGCSFVQLSYSWVWAGDGKPDFADYRVGLLTTPMRFGGVRWWFVCPLTVAGRTCGRRVAKLHLPSGSRWFGCRDCHQLSYRSRQEGYRERSLARLLRADDAFPFGDILLELRNLAQRDGG
jgi:hypothetical protein